ncbi:MAG: DUF58 domain-containing protein [Alphaproteobacteria bacterium CG_4_10_14_0_2_um_filter_63_37]|nr:MAG: DUF58 domain-containing protein [Alphaproteobacteria bacterium CG_4_10_14_0_2_um_filter_63_37]
MKQLARLRRSLSLARFFTPQGREVGPITLVRRRVYILPTRTGLLLTGILFVMLIGSINYGSSLGYLLTFWLAAIGLVAMFHTYRNLVGLTLAAGGAPPVFAGQSPHATLRLTAASVGQRRLAIALERPSGTLELPPLDPGQATPVTLSLSPLHRGAWRLGMLVLSTRYPLGLFRAWSNIDLDMELLVYPPPADPSPLPPGMEPGEGALQGSGSGRGEEEFAGIRPYQAGDSLRRVHWKGVARGHGMQTKLFEGEAQGESGPVLLDWGQLHEHEDEARLSRLCRWILDCEALGRPFALKLPGIDLPVGQGEGHALSALAALARFGQSDLRDATPQWRRTSPQARS